MNVSRTDKCAPDEFIELVSATVTNIYELTEAEISQVVGGDDTASSDRVKSPTN